MRVKIYCALQSEYTPRYIQDLQCLVTPTHSYSIVVIIVLEPIYCDPLALRMTLCQSITVLVDCRCSYFDCIIWNYCRVLCPDSIGWDTHHLSNACFLF